MLTKKGSKHKEQCTINTLGLEEYVNCQVHPMEYAKMTDLLPDIG